jgi:hypothetical protein
MLPGQNSVALKLLQFQFQFNYISNSLKWNTYIQFLCSQLNTVFCMITSLIGDFSLLMLRNIYFAKFQSLLRHGIILWSGEIENVLVQTNTKKGTSLN